MERISETKTVRLMGMTIEEVITLLQYNNYTLGEKVEKITIKMERASRFDEQSTCSIRDLLNPPLTGKYTVEFSDNVNLIVKSKDDLKGMHFDTNIIP